MAAKRSSNGALRSGDIARRAVEQVGALTGRPIEGVLGLRRDDDNWVVTLEVLELHRVPETTDVLASYDVVVDARGDLQEYRRTRRYARNQVEDD